MASLRACRPALGCDADAGASRRRPGKRALLTSKLLGEVADPQRVLAGPVFAPVDAHRAARRAAGERDAGFLAALYKIDPAGGPLPGKHSCQRGAPVSVWDGEARQALKALEGEIDTASAARVWEEALAAPWDGKPVWVHGDVADGNLLTDQGRLSAVIDFGCCAVGCVTPSLRL